MDTPRSPPGNVRRHSRNISHPTPQRATRGPLEAVADDPLAGTAPSPSISEPPEVTQSTPTLESRKAPTPQPLKHVSPATNKSIPDLLFLLDPDKYNQLFVDDIPKAFLESEHQPSIDTVLPDLIAGGHFRFAADRALADLLASPGDVAEDLFQLLYTRLACLILISRPDLAAQEAAPLIELITRYPSGAQDVVSLIPWDLRLLLVRLQSIGAADGGRRGTMALYALAGEVRGHIRAAREKGDVGEVAAWSSRLQDLGIRVCDALVEMGELETATRHLDTLAYLDADELAYRKALLRIRVGDVSGAQRFVEKLQLQVHRKGLQALLKVADGDYPAAAESWQALIEEFPSHELFAQNAAVSMLYTGHIASARDVLEDLSTRLPMFPTLLFNLSTVYELCTERASELKLSLTERAAAKTPEPASGGWERSTFEFKL